MWRLTPGIPALGKLRKESSNPRAARIPGHPGLLTETLPQKHEAETKSTSIATHGNRHLLHRRRELVLGGVFNNQEVHMTYLIKF